MSEGGCACGKVRYRLDAEPMFVHCCHCLNCQRQTGSAFVINLLVEDEHLQLLSGELHATGAPRDDGSVQTISRCPTCEVAVFSHYGWPELTFVRAGTLDDPSTFMPDVHIYTRSKLPWVTLPHDVPSFEAYYDMRALWPTPSLARLDAVIARREAFRTTFGD